MSGYACLIDSTEGEDGYAQIVAGHFGSKSRFNQYIKNMIFLNQQSITVKNMDCELTGNGVDPISCCFNNINWNSWVPEGCLLVTFTL